MLKRYAGAYIAAESVKGFLSGGTTGAKKGREKAIQYYKQMHIAKHRECFPSEEELEVQRKHLFSSGIKFSVVVPLYNTPEIFLHEMIGSVMAQTYENWELCMADGSDKDHEYVEKVCRFYSKLDPRVKYRKLDKNGGISDNTNACMDMARGSTLRCLIMMIIFIHVYYIDMQKL